VRACQILEGHVRHIRSLRWRDRRLINMPGSLRAREEEEEEEYTDVRATEGPFRLSTRVPENYCGISPVYTK